MEYYFPKGRQYHFKKHFTVLSFKRMYIYVVAMKQIPEFITFSTFDSLAYLSTHVTNSGATTENISYLPLWFLIDFVSLTERTRLNVVSKNTNRPVRTRTVSFKHLYRVNKMAVHVNFQLINDERWEMNRKSRDCNVSSNHFNCRQNPFIVVI